MLESYNPSLSRKFYQLSFFILYPVLCNKFKIGYCPSQYFHHRMLTHAFTESGTAILDESGVEEGQPLGIATRLVQSAFAGASSSTQLSFEEFRRWIVETQLFLVVWQNVFDPYEASGFRSPMEVPVFVPTLDLSSQFD